MRTSVFDLPRNSNIRLREYSNFTDGALPLEDFTGVSEDEKSNTINKIKENAKNQLNTLKNDLGTAASKKVNNIVNGLVNDTLGKLRNTYGIRDISAPQNVYNSQGLGNILKGDRKSVV